MKRILILSLLQLLAFSVFSQIDIAMDKIVRNNTNYLQIRVTNTSTEDMMIIQPKFIVYGYTLIQFFYYQGDTNLNNSWEYPFMTEEDETMHRVRERILLKKGVTLETVIDLDEPSTKPDAANKVEVHCIIVATGTKRYSAYKKAEFSLLSSSSLPKKPIEQVTDPIGDGPVDSDKRPIN